MSENVSELKIHKVISEIKHSAIDCTLVDLGIIRDVEIQEKNVTVTLAFPFENIPIKEYLIMSVTVPLERMGLKVEVKTIVMNEDESRRFLDMETQFWKGGS
jgi:metal-sulfur cluster biosynthetic enzyme